MVEEFHRAFNHPIGNGPVHILLEDAEKRADWMREEIDEYLEAVEAGDLVDVYDAILDILYFAIGTAVVHGMEIDPGFAAVQSSNMSKLGADGKPVYGEDGKIQKGPNFALPRLEPIIRAQLQKARLENLAYELASVRDGSPTTLPPLTQDELTYVLGRATEIRDGQEVSW